MRTWLDVVAIFVTGLMVGNEFAIAAFVHPVLWRLGDDAHAAFASALARVLGRVMPFWYALGLVLVIASAFARHRAAGQWPLSILAAATLWALVIAATIAVLVPINNRIGSWTDTTRPETWKGDRGRWDRLHRWRVGFLALSFAIFVWGVIGTPTP